MEKKCEGYKKLIKRIVEERVTGKPSESKWAGNKYTERGHDLEPIAIEAYELETFNKVIRVGLVEMNEWCVCSPDGFIGNDTLIQVKNPIFSTQWDYLEDKQVPTDYYKQMQFELMTCERKKNIFYSYHPNLPSLMLTVERDEKIIEMIRWRLDEAIEEAKKRIEQIGESK
jgi:exodeoxyribonuclease (lambda-induced)